MAELSQLQCMRSHNQAYIRGIGRSIAIVVFGFVVVGPAESSARERGNAVGLTSVRNRGRFFSGC